MSIEPGPGHGMKSRELCMQFLNKYNLHEKDYEDVLDTIGNHDNKDYTSKRGSNDLLKLLSVADDLDAFSFVGIYRYSEIYLIRGINPNQLGNLILENAGNRFKNFRDIYGAQNFYVQFHQKRYEILKNFFLQYNKQSDTYNFLTNEPEGYCGVIQLLILLIRNKLTLEELFTVARTFEADTIIGPFMIGLRSELSPNYPNE
jgi:hypothetical protein